MTKRETNQNDDKLKITYIIDIDIDNKYVVMIFLEVLYL